MMLVFFWSPPAICQDSEGPSDSPLIQAIWEKDLSRARAIVAQGVNPNARDRFRDTALGEAIAVGLSDFAEELVNAGADPNLMEDGGTTPLMQAAWNCNLRVAKFLLNHGAQLHAVNYGGESALMQAAYACTQGEMTKFLIQASARIDASDKSGHTALTLAADNGNFQAVKELLLAGANVSIKNDDGQTAENLACGRDVGREPGHDRVCELLRNTSRRDK